MLLAVPENIDAGILKSSAYSLLKADEKISPYEKYKTALISFTLSTQPKISNGNVLKTNRKPGESALEYSARLSSLISDCNTKWEECEIEKLVSEKIIESCPAHIRSLLEIQNLNLTSSIKVVDNMNNDTGRNEGYTCNISREKDLVEMITKEIERKMSHLNFYRSRRTQKPECAKYGGYHDTKDCRRIARCRECGKLCHVTRKCKSKKIVNSVTEVITYLNFDGQKITCLADTGSPRSLISAKCIKNKMYILPLNSFLNLYTANGKPLEVLGEIEADAVINTKMYKWKFFVINKLFYPSILGRDFLSHNKISVDFNKLTLTQNIENSCKVNIEEILWNTKEDTNIHKDTTISKILDQYKEIFRKHQ